MSPMNMSNSIKVLTKDRLAHSLIKISMGSSTPSIGTPSIRTNINKLQSLWAGYGVISRVHVVFVPPCGGDLDLSKFGSLILKQVSPPPSLSSSSLKEDVSHLRKLKSYQVEAAFYSSEIPAELASRRAHVPMLIDRCGDVVDEGGLELLLSDLDNEGFASRLSGSKAHVEAALTLLAKIHATYFERKLPEGLWEQACYWHLETRLSELREMSDKRLQSAAPALDRRLRQATRGMTLLHGDAKADNLLIGDDGGAAAYDFQYTGAGLGARDVAYLLVSSCDARTLELEEASLLNTYHAALLEAGVPPTFTRDMLQDDFDISVADYMRFMDGWGEWGNARWARKRTNVVLDRLEQAMKTSGDWDGAIATVYSQ